MLHSIQVRNLEVNHLGRGRDPKPGVGQGSLLVDHYLAGTGRPSSCRLPPSTLGRRSLSG